MRKFISVFLLMLTVLTLSSCKGEKRTTRQSFAFDTVINITVNENDVSHIDEAFNLCNKYENIFSRTKENSELYKINCGLKTPLSEDMQKILSFSQELSQITEGAFDVTVVPLTDLWNVKERSTPPTDSEIELALSSVGYEGVSLSPFDAKGRQFDLGGVAKGYIADRLGDYFKEKDIGDVIIDLGGNVLLLGEYSVGIRDPFNPEELFATITVKDKSAVTSGAYQRYFEHEGKRYHHIIDPRTGKCADSGISSVTVISPSSMRADALSTAIFVMGEEGLRLCESFPDTDALIITNEGDVVTTENFAKKYNLQCK